MSQQPSERQAKLRSTISSFLSERLNVKLEILADDDPKRDELRAQFMPATWLEDAALRVRQIQAVTHSLKPIHPEAKGSSLFCDPTTLAPLTELGSHALGADFALDVVGNAAALDVYKFLKLEFDGRTLLNLALQADVDLCAALSEDRDTATRWMLAFATLAAPRGSFSSHTQAKQLYWPIGDDLHDDDGYHLLAPLYPTSLVHRVYLTLQADRFGDSAKAAREARKAGEWHDHPVREYPQLAIQKLGGTKPQNISQLNSERRGDNCLLASLPPVWQSERVKPVLGVDSLFTVFQWRRGVRDSTAQLRRFLEGDPRQNIATREYRDEIVEVLVDELVQFRAETHELEPGWTAEPRCELPHAHISFLDLRFESVPVADWADALASDFARWLNAKLRTRLAVGDAEYLHWRKQARDMFVELEREGSYDDA